MDVALIVKSIVWPLKFQLELVGSCGMRMQIGTSSGVERVAMKSASERLQILSIVLPVITVKY